MDRRQAKAEGLTRYTGKACVTCGNTERLVRNCDCIYCRNVAKSSAMRAKRLARGPVKIGRPRKYPELVGPLTPKKSRGKKFPAPITEFEKWVHRSRYNKKRVGVRNQLTYEMYMALYVTHCPLLGLELTYSVYDQKFAPNNYASLDRIDPNKGYVEGNVQIISFRANSIKSNATLEELKMIVDNWTNQKL